MIECSKCGAPLEPAAGASSARCGYCGVVTAVAAAQPQVVVNVYHGPPAPAPLDVSSLATAGVATAAGTGGCASLLGVAITGVVIVGIGAAVIIPLLASGVGGASLGLGWDGSEPLICDGVERTSASGVTAALPTDIALEAGGNCHLELQGVNLTADQVLVAGGNAHVTIRDSTLRTTQPIEIGANGRLTLRDSTLIAEGVAIALEGNGRVELRGGRIEHGGGEPFRESRRGRVELHRTEIVRRP